MNPFLLTTLYVEPGKKPEVKEIDNSLEAMKELVHGNIDSVGIDDGICVISNSLAEVLKMPHCTTIYGQEFFGPIIIVEFTENGELQSLEEDNIDYYVNLLGE